MLRRGVLLTCFFCLCETPGLALGAPPKPPEQVALTVIPATPSFFVGDALLIKAVLKNNVKASVALSRPFSADWAGISAEVCPPGETAFKGAALIWEGINCGGVRKLELPAGASIVCYERLFWNNSGPIFSDPGKWRIRVSVTVGESVITSEPVELSIMNPPKHIKKALAEYVKPIESALQGYQTTDEEMVKTMLEARDVLRGSNAAQAIAQARVLSELLGASSQRARQFALTTVQKHRADLSPVGQEEFDLLTAEVLCRLKEYDKAKKIVDAISETSEKRNFLLASIRRRD